MRGRPTHKGRPSSKKTMVSANLIKQIVNKIREKVEPEKIIVFGSSVREDISRNSDIDIALWGVEAGEIYLLKEYLNEEVDTLQDIDLIDMDNSKNEKLKERILKEGITIYERSSDRQII